jgi:hypothetical protein
MDTRYCCKEIHFLDDISIQSFTLLFILGTVNTEHQLDATITVLLISKINSKCFGQTFAHLQERRTEIFRTYGIMSCSCGRQGFWACCLALRLRYEGGCFAHLQERKTEIFTTYGIMSGWSGRQGFWACCLALRLRYEGGFFAHLQKRKTEIFTTYGIMSCWCVRQGFWACCLALRVRMKEAVSFIHSVV